MSLGLFCCCVNWISALPVPPWQGSDWINGVESIVTQQGGRLLAQLGVGLHHGHSLARRQPREVPDILKDLDSHLYTCASLAAIFGLPAQTGVNTSSLLEAMMSIKVLPAVLLPSGDKVVSILAAGW